MAGLAPSGEYAKSLDDAVKKVKVNEKWRKDYMSLAFRIGEEREIADLNRVVSALKELRGEMSERSLARVFHLEPERLRTILDAIDANPDKTDWEIAELIHG